MSEIDINGLFEYLPHRYPFLLVDRITEVKPGESIKGVKCVTYNEPFFAGHFPNYAIMPGVMIVESLAQLSGVLIFKTQNLKPGHDNWFFLAGIDNARFKRQVKPGDRLELQAILTRTLRDVWKFTCSASVDGEIVCTVDIMNAKGKL